MPYSLELRPKMPEDPLRAFFQRLPEGCRAPVINAWSSLLAGLVAYTVATPIEAFKVGIQTWPGSTLAGIGRNILKTRGPGGFFNGLDAMLWAGLPYSLVMYGCYQPVRKVVNEKLQAAGIDPGIPHFPSFSHYTPTYSHPSHTNSSPMSIFSGHGVWCTLPGEAELGEAELFSRLLLLTTSFTTGSYGQFMGAAVAETLGMVVFIPGELVRMRMMNNPGRYSSFIQASFTQTAIYVSSYTRILLLTYIYTRTALHVSTLLLYSGCSQNHPKRRRWHDVQACSIKALLRLC
jgi:hypothetical protein